MFVIKDIGDDGDSFNTQWTVKCSELLAMAAWNG